MIKMQNVFNNLYLIQKLTALLRIADLKPYERF